LIAAEDKEARERDEIRQDRHRERARERNIARAAPDKRFVNVNDFETASDKTISKFYFFQFFII